MFKKILIANRGEIACRVIRTAKKLGIQTVAVYSEADAHALHVKMADEAYFIGPSPTSESYLRGETILEVARNSGAEAIHPGYGFLSENAAFAESCAKAGICFIGPPPQAIRAMGGKSTAKQIMQKAGVPVTPGYHADDQNPQVLRKAADEIGYPVLIKAVAGGGGKGMRVVNRAEDFSENLVSAQKEAKASFGDDRVLLEKYLTNPRHVEVQVFADAHGHALYLYERDCSVQRRHQKIIEEAPAPGVDGALRNAMGMAAVNAARAIDYRGAGTIEFLLDADGSFYFMEMNTRLQVEHPVTEMITGQDLVEWQLLVAAGEPMPITEQAQLPLLGHAFEARIYAEDPQKDFMPSVGTLKHLKMPTDLEHVRVDSGVMQGDSISVYYDPMIAKLIVWGEDRKQALLRMSEALAGVEVVGVQTNIALLAAIVTHPAFIEAQLSTRFIERHAESLLSAPLAAPDEVCAIAALAVFNRQKTVIKSFTEHSVDTYSPWFISDSWRVNLPAKQILRLRENDKKLTIVASLQGMEITILQIDDKEYSVENIAIESGKISALIGQSVIKAAIVFVADDLHVFTQGQHFVFTTTQQAVEQSADIAQRVMAPMPGALTEIFVAPGQTVKKGERLVVVEAMKMQHTLYAPIDGVVKDVFFNTGDLIDEGAQLISWEETV